MVYHLSPANQARGVSGHWPPNYNLSLCIEPGASPDFLLRLLAAGADGYVELCRKVIIYYHFCR